MKKIHTHSGGILRKIYGSPLAKATALLLVAEMGIQLIHPQALMALTSGPSQPEVESFKPIGVTDMVDPFTGDFSYNIPLLSVGDYPINLAYQSGVTMDDEASWSGLGWNVHTGAITRQLRGLPDDFWGEPITRRVYLRDNLTVGVKVAIGAEAFGLELPENQSLDVGIDINYNSHKGIGLSSDVSAGLGIGGEGAKNPLNLGLSLGAGPEGLDVKPNLSFSAFVGNKHTDAEGSGTLGFGCNINSREGLSAVTLNYSATLTGNEKKVVKDDQGNAVKDAKGNDTYEYTGKSNTTDLVSGGSSISLGQPTFSPKMDLPMNNFAASGRFKIGGDVFGADFDITVVGYGSRQKLAKNTLVNPSYGYFYSEKGMGDGTSLHDFNREKDGSFTSEKKNLPLTNFTHDVFSIAAQGMGGTFRAFRNDVGYVYDNHVTSPSTSADFGVELNAGNAVDFGLDVTVNTLESESGAWVQANAAADKLKFRGNHPNDITENFHLKMTGEKTVESDAAFYNQINGKTPVRFDLDDDSKNYEVAAYNKFIDPAGNEQSFDLPHRGNRQRRNSAVYYFTKADILRSAPWKAKYLSPHAANHHIAEIVVVQPDGKRYVFGLAAYNSKQTEITFNAGEGGSAGALSRNAATGLVDYVSQSNIAAGTKRGIDHYYDETETPAYAHSWMLTEVLSPDYVDVTGDGPTADDFGTYVKFNYGKPGEAPVPDVQNFKWRTPTTNAAQAAYMEGLKSDDTDDKANLMYGEKDIWYVNSIESKTQIAVFDTEDRQDALGALPAGTNDASLRLQALKTIKLYAKPEYDADPNAAVPVKTVHFEYDYSLCPQTPNSVASGQGKLTLKKVFFTYRGSDAGRYSPYEFNYRTHDNGNNVFAYRFGAVDRWNTYRPAVPVSGISATGSEFPYADQNKARRDDYASAWHLNRITLPSGGEINVKYESDEYAYVQNKAAMRMFKVFAMGKGDPGDPDAAPTAQSTTDSKIYTPLTQNEYLIVNLEQAVADDNTFKQQYLVGQGNGDHANGPLKYMYYRCMVTLNNGSESPQYDYISGYAEIDLDHCGLMPGSGGTQAYIHLQPTVVKMSGVDVPVSPLAYSAWQFSRINTPKKAFNQPEYGEPAIAQFVQTLASANILSQILQFFQGPNGRMFAQGFGNRMDPSRSWVRLFEPDKNKLGGGNRVKEITLSDGWDGISPSESGASYGQEFSYVDKDGITTGVAAYEPGVGADENVFRIPLFYNGEKQILIPEERYYMEEPFGESFFPAPTIGYSQVTIKDKSFDNQVTQNLTGKTVHEFYTAYDFPTEAVYTPLKTEERKSGVLGKLLKVNSRDYMTATQGYTVVVNDMHGKSKTTSMYAQDELAPFSYVHYQYKTSTDGKLDNNATVVDERGNVSTRAIGIETDMVADMREQSTVSNCVSVTGNIASMFFGIIPAIIPTLYGSFSKEKTRFRSAVTTKMVSVYGIQERTINMDKGAITETRLVAFDAQTGDPIIQELNNEFKDKYYMTNYPVHWTYGGMGQASQNIGYTFTVSHLNATTGVLTDTYVEPGDEVLPLWGDPYSRTAVPHLGNANTARLWVARDDVDHNLYLIDAYGQKFIPPTNGPGHFRIIRSGHRNMQGASLGSVTSLVSPMNANPAKLTLDQNNKVIAASAMEFAEQWQTERGLQKGEKGDLLGIHAEYDARTLALIRLINRTIAIRGQLTTPAGGTDMEQTQLQPYYSQLNIGCTPPAMVNYHSQVLTDVLYPTSYIPFGKSASQVYPAWAAAAQPSALPNTSVPTSSLGISWADCIGCSMYLQAFDPQTGFTHTDWDHIDHFKETIDLDNSQPFPLWLVTTLNTYHAGNLFIAVMDDNSEKLILFAFKNCYSMSNTVQEFYDTKYVCSYVAGNAINPYLYSLLGNWRGKGDYFFMGDRNNMNASTAENLRNDGYLSQFKAFWKAPLLPTDAYWAKNIPNANLGLYENWNHKTEMTLYSPYGFDLENKNPLPAYSSAQYGYQNLLPLAVAGNAMQKEIGYDGFEDYYPSIPKSECWRDHFKFEDNLDHVTTLQAHTGIYSMQVDPYDGALSQKFDITAPYGAPQTRTVPYLLNADDLLKGFSPNLGQAKKYVMCFWVRTYDADPGVFDYTGITPDVKVDGVSVVLAGSLKKSKIIGEWQRYELEFTIPAAPTVAKVELKITNSNSLPVYVDDMRVHPFDANLKAFVYDKDDYKYRAQLDENNFATFYEYDKEGRLVRLKQETERGIVTLRENRVITYKH